jgi:hypothetical protein
MATQLQLGMGGHQSAAAGSTTWLTPPHVIEALGGPGSFDLDPCAAPEPRPWATARRMFTEADGDGLSIAWDGRVWLNPPYTTAEAWLERLADHDQGTALIFARTETETFQNLVFGRARGLLYLKGRLFFHHADGTRAKHNGGAPSVLCAYGQEDMDRLAACDLEGHFEPLRFARMVMVAGLDQSWAQVMRDWIGRQRGPVSVSDAYRYFARHPKAKANPNWRAKVRQKLAAVAHRVERDCYVPAVA